ncbi:MAG TPA: hypothetical protein VFQ63_03180 [Patescibacteria group bacterium]|nr:hypothetical protein [Patescibacteria group bacterium]
MAFERDASFTPQEAPVRDAGFSEEEQAKVIEGSHMDIKQIKKRKPIQTVSRQQKIYSSYLALGEKVSLLVGQLSDMTDNERQRDMLLSEIKQIRALQDELLSCLLLEQRGELSQLTTSKEAWNLIE